MNERRPIDRLAIVLAALTGATAWISFGALAVTSDRLARVGVLPPLWALPVLMVAAAGLATLLRLPRAVAWPLLPAFVLWLPWLPMAITPAVLIWEGPLESVVWTAALGGMMLLWRRAGPADRVRAVGGGRRAPQAVAVMALVITLGAAVVLARDGRIPGGDEPHYLIITQSLLSDGDLRIENNHDRGDYFAYMAQEVPPDFLQRGTDGEIYSVHAPGLSALLIPAFAIGGYPASVVFVALISAAGLAAAWMSAFVLCGCAEAAWAGSLAVFFSATVLLHSFSIFPDPVGGAIAAVLVLLLAHLQVEPERVQRVHFAGMGALLGLLPWLHTRFAVVAGTAAVAIVARIWARADRVKALGTFAAAPIASAVLWFGYFYLISGTPSPAAPYGSSEQNAYRWIGAGLTGLLVDQQFGIVAAAPVLAVVPAGLVALGRIAPRLVVELVGMALPYTLVVASFGMWWGGRSAPARFLDCLMPLAVPVLALAWRDAGRAMRSVFIALVLAGAANIAFRVFVADGGLLFNNRDGFDLLLDWLSRHVNVPLAFPSVLRSGPALALFVAAAWLALVALALALLSLLSRRIDNNLAQWAATAVVGCLTLTAGLAVSWRLTRDRPVTTSSSQAEFIRRWNPSRRPMAVLLPALRPIDLSIAEAGLELETSVRFREVVVDHALLGIPSVPAGDYRVVIEGASQLAGTLTVSVGGTSQAIETWPLDGRTSGLTPLHVTLPAAVHSLVIRGDAAAWSRINRLTLRPNPLTAGADSSRESIIRGARYRDARAFFLDDDIYMETAGLWTRGDSTARFFLVPDRAGETASVDVQAGPVPVSLDWTVGAWRMPLDLRAGERRRIQVPTNDVMSVRTVGAFRPVDHDPGSEDRRRLGVRLEFPGSSEH